MKTNKWLMIYLSLLLLTLMNCQMLKNRKPQSEAGSTALCSKCDLKHLRITKAPRVTNLSYRGGEHLPVNSLRVSVTSYSNNEVSLVNQTGTIHIKGKVSANNAPCLGDQAWPFDCTASILYGNITTKDCKIGDTKANMMIVLRRQEGEGLLPNPNAFIDTVIFKPQIKCFTDNK